MSILIGYKSFHYEEFLKQRNQPKSQMSCLDIWPGDILWRETHGSLNPLCFKSSMVIISKLKLGFSGDFHKVGTIISCLDNISWLDKISWLDISCWGVKVIRAILQCHLTHTCYYFDALGLYVLANGKIFALDHTIGSYEDFMDLQSSG